MKILGIDPGYERCGFAVLEGERGNFKLLASGAIRTTPQQDFVSRLAEVAEDFESLLNQHKPAVVGIEDLFFSKNVTTAMKVAEVRGALLVLAHRHGCHILQPKPNEVKNGFTGNGNATKKEMTKMVQQVFGLSDAPMLDDTADAIAIAHFVAHQRFA